MTERSIWKISIEEKDIVFEKTGTRGSMSTNTYKLGEKFYGDQVNLRSDGTVLLSRDRQKVLLIDPINP